MVGFFMVLWKIKDNYNINCQYFKKFCTKNVFTIRKARILLLSSPTMETFISVYHHTSGDPFK